MPIIVKVAMETVSDAADFCADRAEKWKAGAPATAAKWQEMADALFALTNDTHALTTDDDSEGTRTIEQAGSLLHALRKLSTVTEALQAYIPPHLATLRNETQVALVTARDVLAKIA